MIIKSIIVIMLDLIIMIGDVCVCTCVCMCLCGLICSQKYEYLEGYDSKCGIFFRTISCQWGIEPTLCTNTLSDRLPALYALNYQHMWTFYDERGQVLYDNIVDAKNASSQKKVNVRVLVMDFGVKTVGLQQLWHCS